MGCDKAFLLVDGEVLWRRQVRKLEAVCGQVWLSSGSHHPEEFGEYAVRCLPDAAQGAGPLAGVVGAMERVEADRFVVLAVDMPAITVEVLAFLLRKTRAGSGLVPCVAGRYEGLCAVYPRSMLPLMAGQLSAGNYAMQSMVRAGMDAGLLNAHPVGSEEEAFFTNWNAPEDLRGGARARKA
jgi:molybdopterin-guanine dinucleotide biosynthesis protein A